MVFVHEEFASTPNMVIEQQNQPIREASGLSPNTNQNPPSINQQEQPQQEPFVTASRKNASPDDHDTTNECFDEEEFIDQAFFESFPPGYRFCPTDSELIVYYLRKKIAKEALPPNQIRHVNLYQHSPDKISARYPPIGEKEWYFFTPRDRKYRNGSRPNRAAGSGYWKATGADKPVKYNGTLFGFRKALVFYEGKPPKGVKSNWIMHEYRVNEPIRKKTCPADMRLDDFVLCRIYKKTDKSFKSRPRNVLENVDQNDYPTLEENERYDQDYAYPSYMGNNIDPGRIDRELNAIEASPGFVQPQFHTRCSEVPPMMDTTLPNYYKYVNSNFQTPQNYGAKPEVYRAPNSGENAFMPKYSKEDALEIKSGGGIQENLWMKDDGYHYNLPPELDCANSMESLPDLGNILDNPPPIFSFEKSNNPFDSPAVFKRS